MNTTFSITINHPIFNDAEIEVEGSGEYVEPNYEDGYLESAGGTLLEFVKVISINGKTYNKSVIKSMETFLFKNYDEEMTEEFESQLS